ncbi:hypothetical protein K443DRAFT_677595, partial [Laccaria amethystina LaAM-08-1]
MVSSIFIKKEQLSKLASLSRHNRTQNCSGWLLRPTGRSFPGFRCRIDLIKTILKRAEKGSKFWQRQSRSWNTVTKKFERLAKPARASGTVTVL